jgi:hypothetical protein
MQYIINIIQATAQASPRKTQIGVTCETNTSLQIAGQTLLKTRQTKCQKESFKQRKKIPMIKKPTSREKGEQKSVKVQIAQTT